MRKNVFEAKAVNGEIQLLVLADLHIGNEFADLEHIQAMVDYIEQTPNAYFVLNGDLVENSTKHCPASVFNDTLPISEQIATIGNILKPIVSQGKCVNATIGNHELRSQKENGLDPMAFIVSGLTQYDEKMPEKYQPEGAYTFIRMTNIRPKGTGRDSAMVITLKNEHGNGGGNVLNRLKKMQTIPASIYIRSHLHEYNATPSTILIPDYIKYNIREEMAWAVSNGCTLRYGGYTQFNEYQPNANIFPVITIKAVRHSYDKGGKRSDYYDKQIEVVGRDKQWFLDQVRCYGKNKNK